ncbi:MAG: MFS transporter [Pseudonocardia sp.]|uniref:MFS transporter n=1 Tax=unclassified Pseudonocardia TaxID=2619320 RepID=UPI00086ADE0D|nr:MULTISPECIES: MFS transporter [unclassified Pseudonocardia]MBN9109119.1 MFS transporter [Pseudonocardia sp.]ODU22501.1 MAG: MFS transporter [Pseudonocardia sp. SCN 72-51]ODV02513.1 MAG: MFS transporter [Pseudonocardia sp. SCN 73-27]
MPVGRPQLRRARVATFALFATNGLVMGAWVVQIPAIERQTGVGHALLGLLLLVLGGGAFVGMQACGPLSDRVGARLVAPIAAALCSLALLGPTLAGDAVGLAVALLLLGLGNGALDVAMNAHAVQVERHAGRPIMSAFHATYSLGAGAAALLGGVLAAADARPLVPALVVAGAGVVVAASTRPFLLPREQVPDSGVERPTGRRVRTPGRIWGLAVLALCFFLAEGVANDWSTLNLTSVHGATPALAAAAYIGFSVAMTGGRLVADRVTARVGPVAVVRWGGLIGALGLTVVVVAPSVPVAVVGWTVFGLGVSGCVPQLFSAAGAGDPRTSGTFVARVAGLGYLGMLAGPAVIGPLTALVPLNVAFLLPAALCAAAAMGARLVRSRPQENLAAVGRERR